MNKAAQTLGRLARGVPKNYTAAELARRKKRLADARLKRWKKPEASDASEQRVQPCRDWKVEMQLTRPTGIGCDDWLGANMKREEAIEKLERMQRQIVHGTNIFGDIANIIRKDGEKLNRIHSVATGAERTQSDNDALILVARIIEAPNEKLRDAGEIGVE